MLISVSCLHFICYSNHDPVVKVTTKRHRQHMEKTLLNCRLNTIGNLKVERRHCVDKLQLPGQHLRIENNHREDFCH